MIKLKDIHLKFKDKVLFSGFDLSVKEGETVLLSAASGHGKTSLFRIMMGFMRPDSGSVYIGGKLLRKSTVHAMRRRISYIGQDVSLPGGKARELFREIGAYAVNRHKDFSDARIKELLNQFSLTEQILDKNMDTVSGGERRRLAFVLCVLMDRDIWLLDEITAGLDKRRKQKVIEYIVGSGKTVLVSSHDEAWNDICGVRSMDW